MLSIIRFENAYDLVDYLDALPDDPDTLEALNCIDDFESRDYYLVDHSKVVIADSLSGDASELPVPDFLETLKEIA